VGLDRDPEIVAEGQQAGLPMLSGDALEHLDQHPDTYDGIVASHLLEHLPFPILTQFIVAAGKALVEKGKLLLVFPNPESIRMQCFGFWKDPEHVRFYHADLVRSVCGHAHLDAQVFPVASSDPALAAPMASALHQDWASLDLSGPFQHYESLLPRSPLSGDSERAAHPVLKALLSPIARLVAKALMVCSGPGSKLAVDVGQMNRQAQDTHQRVLALQTFTGELLASLGRFHETQGRLVQESDQRSQVSAETFNESLGVMVRTLNGVWGVPEESAVLAMKSHRGG
jgi:hypothetical protein